jgi:UDP-2-acetamido-2,6-beta-L-arabino-hexul-4-ose reductase
VAVGVAGSVVGLAIGIYFGTRVGWWPLGGVMAIGAVVRLVYVDDVVADFLRRLDGDWPADGRAEVASVYEATVGELADTIQTFRSSRQSLMTAPVGTGLTRALYATYVSYLPPGQFTYDLPKHGDARGVFVEMLKTPDCGQFSFFTAHPGVTRGGHYHHTKTEKFLVIKGTARFRFRHILSDESFELRTSGDQPTVVESVPGWAHDITNEGDTEMFVMLWANEVFDRARPDTYAHKV